MRSSQKVWTAAGVTAGIDLALHWSKTTTAPGDCPDGCPLARPAFRADPVGRPSVRWLRCDATRQTDLDPPGAGGHRGRAGARTARRIGSTCGHEPASFHSRSKTRSARRPAGTSNVQTAPRCAPPVGGDPRHRGGNYARCGFAGTAGNHAPQLHPPRRISPDHTQPSPDRENTDDANRIRGLPRRYRAGSVGPAEGW